VMAFSEPCISIPVQDSDELVLISASELPVEPEDLLDLLRGEYAPLHLWLDFAKAYMANGKVRCLAFQVCNTCMPSVSLILVVVASGTSDTAIISDVQLLSLSQVLIISTPGVYLL